MNQPNEDHVLPVSSDPAVALSETVLAELNRMHARIVKLEEDNKVLVERVGMLWGMFNALGKLPQ
jgi:hypothetical protein